MKISDMIKNLYAFMDEHGDLDCWYSEDEEGNAYHPVYFKPALLYVNDYGNAFGEEDIEVEDPEDIAELTKICVVN